MCLLPELEQFAAMDDMADWGVTHIKEPVCTAATETEPTATKAEIVQSEAA